MNEEAIKAADLVRKAPRKLTRYSPTNATLTELSGLIDDVRTIDRNDAWIVVRPVDGLPDHVMGTATIPNPRPEIDALLEQIGHNGRITLVGLANTTPDEIGKLRMTEVHTVNGTPTAKPKRQRPPCPAPASTERRWWQWWRKNRTGQNADAQA